MSERADFWFFWPTRVRYSEIDGQGVVFNAHYLTYFDTALTEYLRALPYSYGLGGTDGADFHIVKSTVEYAAPIRFDQEIEVGVRTARLGRSSVTFDLAIFDKAGDRALSIGEIVWVNTDTTEHRATALPEAFIEAVRARESP
ncbi:acyl-CoA thioester hydrolase [Herbihabitans rhizosphaerae]|uniref:Acyl-CoA thioester hydrolase n=1 Tax=Herbihabitans rhizosphaerae TaxID=1872711 RepID=A0A4Q7KQD4_9PSEU|nr:thioesterase family protein [Herbihabitans rhizosphaerae]RZS37911.1 acyl-CoA thioester hydrolase [Herbihabitans rhizosphaerae]